MKRFDRRTSDTALRPFLVSALLSAPAPSPPPAAEAATITVDSTAYSGSGCTLVSALVAAETDRAWSGCIAGSGRDTIVFSVSGTITLLAMLPAIDTEVIIAGSGRGITISGAGSVGVAQVNSTGWLTPSAAPPQPNAAEPRWSQESRVQSREGQLDSQLLTLDYIYSADSSRRAANSPSSRSGT